MNVEDLVPSENPFSFVGTGGPWDEDELQLAFAKARVIEVSAENTRSPTSYFVSNSGAVTPPNPQDQSQDSSATSKEVWALRVAKAGILIRKDDVLEGGKKAINRKWKAWSVILTSSQLLFFRDPTWAPTFLAQAESSHARNILPQASIFKPDELLSLQGSVAVHDTAYEKVRYLRRRSLRTIAEMI